MTFVTSQCTYAQFQSYKHFAFVVLKCTLFVIGPTMKCTDGEVLVLKATAQATLGCLEECLYALQLQQRACSSKQQGSHSSNKSAFGSTSSMK